MLYTPRVSLTAARYIDEILQDFVVLYVDFVGDARPHTVRITPQFLDDVPVMNCPALSPNVNPIENTFVTCLGEGLEVVFL